MKCLLRYRWVKLPRNFLPMGRGVMGAWSKLASRAAYRKGYASYCGYTNAVSPGMWSGGMVGLKSILGFKNRTQALHMLDKLEKLGLIVYDLNENSKKLTYQISDWVVKCLGTDCLNGSVYAPEGYGFLCLPRNITEKLVTQKYTFEESDAWLDLWCHTVSEDPDNAFSFLAPCVQYSKNGAVLNLETMGQRWGWEKTKVWRFFQKHGDVFALHRLPGAYGCLIFNRMYPTGIKVSIPSSEKIMRILNEMRMMGANKQKEESAHEHINVLVGRFSYWFVKKALEKNASKNRVALLKPHILRAYFSPSNWKNCRYDCKGERTGLSTVANVDKIRGPCRLSVNITRIAKELFIYEP